ncbi:MAG TPA: hypothetical protein PLF62_05035 [Clostridia bacterium]|nr:hypothetical protein [Clostridia bacterium]
MNDLLVVALGGNALQRGQGPYDADSQLAVVRETSAQLARILKTGRRLAARPSSPAWKRPGRARRAGPAPSCAAADGGPWMFFSCISAVYFIFQPFSTLKPARGRPMMPAMAMTGNV